MDAFQGNKGDETNYLLFLSNFSAYDLQKTIRIKIFFQTTDRTMV